MATVVRDLNALDDVAVEVPAEHQYWRADNHTETDGENYLRAEAWVRLPFSAFFSAFCFARSAVPFVI